MGLDTVEIILAAEEKFGIYISDEAARNVFTAGELCDCVLTQLDEQTDGKSTWSKEDAWKAVQDIIMYQLQVKREQVTKDARFVEDLKAD